MTMLIRRPPSAAQLATSTLIGAAMGAGIGALIAKERWTPVGGRHLDHGRIGLQIGF